MPKKAAQSGLARPSAAEKGNSGRDLLIARQRGARFALIFLGPKKSPISANHYQVFFLLISGSGSINLDPAEILVFRIHFTISRPQKQRKVRPGAEAASAAACAFEFDFSLNARKRF
jgi:hypothetical protein